MICFVKQKNVSIFASLYFSKWSLPFFNVSANPDRGELRMGFWMEETTLDVWVGERSKSCKKNHAEKFYFIFFCLILFIKYIDKKVKPVENKL